jgi:hypothetical protein
VVITIEKDGDTRPESLTGSCLTASPEATGHTTVEPGAAGLETLAEMIAFLLRNALRKGGTDAGADAPGNRSAAGC